MLTLTACGGNKKAEEKKEEPAKQTEVENKEVKEEKEDQAEKAKDEKPETIEIILPSGLFGQGVNVEEEISLAKSGGAVTDGKLNSDGSVTYTVTKDQQTALLNAIKFTMNELFDGIIKDESNSIQKMEFSDDVSEFKIFVDKEKYDEKELSSVSELHLTSTLFNAISGKPESKTMIKVLDNATGDVIKELSSDDLNKTE